MLLGVWLGATDLTALAVRPPGSAPPSVLALGVAAALFVLVAGWTDVAVGSGRVSDWRTLLAPAILGAAGLAGVIAPAWTGVDMGAGNTLRGILLIVAGVVLGLSRELEAPPRFYRFAWPTLLAIATAVNGGPSPDPLAEARAEERGVLAGLREAGLDAVPILPSRRFATEGIPVDTYRVEGDTLQFFLLARGTEAGPATRLLRRLSVPPPSHGVPHVHVGPHLVVVCRPGDWRLAAQVERLIRGLAGAAPQGTALA